MMSDKKIIVKLIKLLLLHKGKLAKLFLSLIVTTLISLVIPILSKDLVDKGFIKSNFTVVRNVLLLLAVIEGLECYIEIYKEKKESNLSIV